MDLQIHAHYFPILMQNWKKSLRAFFYLTLLVGLLAGVSMPVTGEKDVKAAPLQASTLEVIINEVAWAGTSSAYTSDEWIELYNPTAGDISLAGWTLSDGGDINISLTGDIPAGGYYLLERDDDDTVFDIAADQTYSGNLANAGETLYLREGAATIDTANISGGGWDGGSTYYSMERTSVTADDATVWASNDGATRNGLAADNTNPINGTPHTSQADVSLTMTVSDPVPSMGDVITFTISVTNINNTGYGSATNLEVMDMLPAGLSHQFSSPSVGSYDFSNGVWTIGSLTVGSTATLTIDVRVEASGSHTNVAEVWSMDYLDADSTPGNAATVAEDDSEVLSVGSSDLRVETSVNNAAPQCGANIVFSIQVFNDGPDAATNVEIRDVLPTGLIYVSDDRGATHSSGTVTWNIATLAGGTSQSINITTRVVTNVSLTNWAEVSASDQPDPDSMPGNLPTDEDDSDDAVVTPDPACKADLSLSQTYTRSTTTAGRVELKITLTNQDTTNPATNVQVKDILPDGLDYVSYTSTAGTYSASAGIWAISTLAANSSATLTITVLAASSGTSTKNFAEVWQSDQYDPDSTPANGGQGEDDEFSLEVPVADLSLTQTVSVAGSNAVFRITVRNNGPDDAANITIQNPKLAANYTYVSHGYEADGSMAGFSYTSASGAWVIPTLLDGDSATLTVTTTYSGALIVNWAQVSAVDEVDPDSLPGNCLDTTLSCKEDDDAGAPSADLSVTQSVSNANPDIGATIIFTITVHNAGIAETANVQVKSLLPSGLTYVSNNLGSAYNKTSGIWTVGTLANGASRTLRITATVAKQGVKTNKAEVWKSDESDPDSTPANNSTLEDDDASATITTYRAIIINEVAWSGTAASADDEWIELYNPSNATIDLTDWVLRTSSGSVKITLSGSISAGGYFLLERDSNATISDVSASQVYTGALSDSGEILTLRDESGKFVDTANGNGGAWPRGSASTNHGSMERQGTSAESDDTWVTNVGTPKNGKDAKGGLIYGTPKKANSRGITATPTATYPAPTAIPLVGRPIINEFLARPGFDWNQDGDVDVFDEFIEIKNIGVVDIDMSGWKLDDEADQGSTPFVLPSLVLKPGEHAIFYGRQTNILLSDGGDTVRLLNASNKIYDAYTYAIAKVEDQSVCRLPDGNGSWYEDCVPTPNLLNSREGEVPSMPQGADFESPVCELPDTLPADFLFAECRGYGADIWRAFFWDEFGWMGEQPVSENMGKQQSFVE